MKYVKGCLFTLLALAVILSVFIGSVYLYGTYIGWVNKSGDYLTTQTNNRETIRTFTLGDYTLTYTTATAWEEYMTAPWDTEENWQKRDDKFNAAKHLMPGTIVIRRGDILQDVYTTPSSFSSWEAVYPAVLSYEDSQVRLWDFRTKFLQIIETNTIGNITLNHSVFAGCTNYTAHRITGATDISRNSIIQIVKDGIVVNSTIAMPATNETHKLEVTAYNMPPYQFRIYGDSCDTLITLYNGTNCFAAYHTDTTRKLTPIDVANAMQRILKRISFEQLAALDTLTHEPDIECFRPLIQSNNNFIEAQYHPLIIPTDAERIRLSFLETPAQTSITVSNNLRYVTHTYTPTEPALFEVFLVTNPNHRKLYKTASTPPRHSVLIREDKRIADVMQYTSGSCCYSYNIHAAKEINYSFRHSIDHGTNVISISSINDRNEVFLASPGKPFVPMALLPFYKAAETNELAKSLLDLTFPFKKKTTARQTCVTPPNHYRFDPEDPALTCAVTACDIDPLDGVRLTINIYRDKRLILITDHHNQITTRTYPLDADWQVIETDADGDTCFEDLRFVRKNTTIEAFRRHSDGRVTYVHLPRLCEVPARPTPQR